jgi:spermidine synthase
MKSFFKRNLLPFSVFITGACVLVIEIVATRVLSPFFGNTIFTTSSIISVILLALSIGYYSGGKIADRHPSLKWFFSIIALSGLGLIIFFSIGDVVLSVVGGSFSLITGPLLSSLILFFLPATLLGMLSPYAVKIQSSLFPTQGTGSVSGTIFFWSTLGSIVGSLSSGFFLIPYFGIREIMITNSLVLFVLGFIPLFFLDVKKNRLGMVVLLILFSGFFVYALQSTPEEKNIYTKDGRYEKIAVLDGQFFGRPVRFFKQDHSLSGAMFLDSSDPKDLVFGYTQYYSIYSLFTKDLKNALVIGGGAYSIPKALLAESQDVEVDVSEIEPSLQDISKKYFDVADSSRLHTYTEDGRRLLSDSSKHYDLIFSDVYYSFFSIPAHFTTKEFFSTAKGKLSKDGIFMANMIGDLSRRTPSLILSEMRTFQEVFPNSYFFAVDSLNGNSSQNIIFVGYNSDKKINFASKEVLENTNELIRSLGAKRIDPERFALGMYPVMTDNYSPVEYLTGEVLKRAFTVKNFFDGQEPLAIIRQLVHYGPRYPTALGHARTQKFITAEMKALGQQVITQSFTHVDEWGESYILTNIIVRLNPRASRRIIIGSHYDSQKISFKNSTHQEIPSPGANNSASGVAVLVNFVRLLSNGGIPENLGIDIVFFDGEEGDENQGGDFKNWKPHGSTYFAEHIKELYPREKPVAGIVLDMVCKKDLKIYKDPSTSPEASSVLNSFWNIARKVDGGIFLNEVRNGVIRDDHTPLNEAGVPSILLIDYEYPEYATTRDTPDKCSDKSLEAVSRALWGYVHQK